VDTKPTLDIPLEIGAVEAAALITSLVSLRKMDDFLNGNRSKPDDIIGEDFELPKYQILDEGLRVEINKCVAHVTEVAIEGHDMWPAYQVAQPIFVDILERLHRSYEGNIRCQCEVNRSKGFIEAQYAIMQDIVEE
jgi:hypothetical protein